jgi:hypothetical protein
VPWRCILCLIKLSTTPWRRMESGGIAPRILNLGTRWTWVASFTPRPLYTQGKSPWYPLDRSLGGPQSRSGRGGEEKNSQPLPGIEPLSSSHCTDWATPATMIPDTKFSLNASPLCICACESCESHATVAQPVSIYRPVSVIFLIPFRWWYLKISLCHRFPHLFHLTIRNYP